MKDKAPIKLRAKSLKNGNKSLYLDIYENGKRRYEYLHLYIIPERTELDKERNRATYQQAEAHRAKRIIEKQVGKYGQYEGKIFGKVTLSSMIADAAEKAPTEKTAKLYRLTGRYINEVGDVLIKNITKNYVQRFIAYLDKQELSDNTRAAYYSKLNAVLNSAERNGIIGTNPCKQIESAHKPHQVRANVEYLTIEEIELLINAVCPNREVKRAFLFACFTGFRISDLRKLTYGSITTERGMQQIRIKQQKTKGYVYVPLSENAVRYLTDNHTIEPSTMPRAKRIFSLPAHSNVNRDLQVWARNAELPKHISFHVSRHTCATLLLTYGADLYTVSKILGHTDIKTTQIYAEVVNAKRAEAVNNVPKL